jgi:hypothetical protein
MLCYKFAFNCSLPFTISRGSLSWITLYERESNIKLFEFWYFLQRKQRNLWLNSIKMLSGKTDEYLNIKITKVAMWSLIPTLITMIPRYYTYDSVFDIFILNSSKCNSMFTCHSTRDNIFRCAYHEEQLGYRPRHKSWCTCYTHVYLSTDDLRWTRTVSTFKHDRWPRWHDQLSMIYVRPHLNITHRLVYAGHVP